MKILFIDTAHPFLREQLMLAGYECDDFPGYYYQDYLGIAGNYSGIVIRSKIPVDARFLKAAHSLRFVARVGAGMENIDVETAEKQGIICLNAPEGNRNAVAEHALGMLLALMNHLPKVDAEVRRGIWIRAANRGTEIKGKTIGIIGFGNTGSAFARKLAGFEAVVLAYDKYKSGFGNNHVIECDMNRIFAEADVLSLHIPLSDETGGLVSADFLNRFKKPIWLINTSRGPIVKTDDLVESLQNGTVKGACLDVLEYERFSFEDLKVSHLPDTFRRLLSMPNVILSPHIAGWTHESHLKMAEVLLDKILALKLLAT